MSIPVVSTAEDLRTACNLARQRGERVALVPTMGSLHAGHLALVDEAKRRASFVVVSIFVNPTQFGPSEDYGRYPRNLDADLALLARLSQVCVFAPPVDEMYPRGDQTRVRVGALAEPLCGRFRPGHFEGVATVVAKLFAVTGSCDAIFGRKDYQQVLVVRRMAQDLLLPVTVVTYRTVRDADGLAMSSRNAFLSPEERGKALSLVRGLDAAAVLFGRGERRARELERAAREPIEEAGVRIEYVEMRGPDDLAEIAAESGERALLAIACRVGTTRLIDNIVLGQDPPPLRSAVVV
jgi:pantoate--beta-alanine ligase